MKAEKPKLNCCDCLKWKKNSKGTYDSHGLKKPNLAWERLKKINELEKALAASEARIKELKNREIELAQIAKGHISDLEERFAEKDKEIKKLNDVIIGYENGNNTPEWYGREIAEKDKQLGEVSKLFNGMKASHDALARKLIGKDDHIEQLQIAYKQLSDSDMERINEKDNTIKALRDDLDLQIDYTRNAYQLGRKDAQGDGLTENDKVIEAAYYRGFKEGRDEAEAEKDKEIEALKLELAAVQEGQVKAVVDRQVNQALSKLREDLPDLDRWRNSKDNLLKSDILTEIDSRRTA